MNYHFYNMEDEDNSYEKHLSNLKYIHYFFYFTGIFTFPLVPIYPAFMLALGIYGKINILNKNKIIPLKTIGCIILFTYLYKLPYYNIIYNLCLTPIFLHLCFLMKRNIVTNNDFIDYLYGGYNYKKLYISMLLNNV